MLAKEENILVVNAFALQQGTNLQSSSLFFSSSLVSVTYSNLSISTFK